MVGAFSSPATSQYTPSPATPSSTQDLTFGVDPQYYNSDLMAGGESIQIPVNSQLMLLQVDDFPDGALNCALDISQPVATGPYSEELSRFMMGDMSMPQIPMATQQPLALDSVEISSQTIPMSQATLGFNQGRFNNTHLSHQKESPSRCQKYRSSFSTEQERKDTAMTRKIGCCIRCRIQKIRCIADPTNPSCCQTCSRAKPNTPLWRIPCLRYKVSECELFRPSTGVKGLEWTKRWAGTMDNIDTWAGDEVRVIFISGGYTRAGVPVKVRKFKPVVGDKVVRTWVSNGVKKSVDIPTWAICDIKDAEAQYDRYLARGVAECLDTVLQERDPLLRETYHIAFSILQDKSQTLGNRDLLAKTLKLWMAVRLTTKSSTIVGDETLGMSQNIIDDKSTEMHGKIPIPPVLGAQLDIILIDNIQKKLREDVLKVYNTMVTKNDKRSWLVIYVVTFILLHNIAMITAHDAGYADKHSLGRRFAREKKVEEYHLGANILLAHFHYCCRGRAPFEVSCKDSDLRAIASLNDEQVKFIHQTRAFITASWEDIREKKEYEDDFFFVSQMYAKGWTPIQTEVVSKQ
ncbi:hypothetical protein TD95_000576 [Thielaviopsis punctulata]|uniref:Zn(2)-C6 fungal-type domain-containing protein n=1 Tax=Thielaviopsis punctulata TaxID=72032 RepID=A0A0F4ZMT7_9PEZI|nr:hypothetical protein TD95_000576 [Thielaviopsis punctulata]